MTDPQPTVGFATTDAGEQVAFGHLGSGPALVMVPGWLSHVSELWTHPEASSTLTQLADGHRFVWFDRIGCGLSDSARTTASLEDDVEQLEAVLDAAGIDRLDLIGYSIGGPTAITFAARHPERVRHLVLYASVARGADLADAEFAAALIAMVRSGWDTASAMLSPLLLPEGTGADIRWFARFQRKATSAENAADLLEWFYSVDARDQLGEVRVPTTVISPTEGAVITMAHARGLATGIPGARLVQVGGIAHDPFIRDDSDVVDAIRTAIEGRPRQGGNTTSPVSSPPKLSRREHDVLVAMAAGGSNKKIAAELGVSVATVERHLTNLYRKLDATGRADAAVRGIRFGLIESGVDRSRR